MLQEVESECGATALSASGSVHAQVADAAQSVHRCIRQMRHCQHWSSESCLQHLGGLAEGCDLNLAQVPEELQGNLFTAVVAAGMRVVPHIKPGSSPIAQR